MKLIVCLDDKNGMLFNRRRQSSDAVVCQKILSLSEGKKLWMNGYSRKLFADTACGICVDEDFLEHAGPEEYCFLENMDISPYISGVDEAVIFYWNRVYPADTRFPMHLLDGWTKVKTDEFFGHSHSKITQEVYIP